MADGLLLDAQGQPTDDPAVMFGDPIGALLPFAQHKGFALAVMCELLGGALSGGRVQDHASATQPDDQQHAVDRVRAGQALCAATQLAQQVAAPRGVVARVAARAPGRRACMLCRANPSARRRASARHVRHPAAGADTRDALAACARAASARPRKLAARIRLTHAMTRRHVTRFTVEFGDCDPAQIVFYPNFLRWMDAASLHSSARAGVPPWRELEAEAGIIGTPIVDAPARFMRAGELRRHDRSRDVDPRVARQELRDVAYHPSRRDVLVEGREVRMFARRHPDDPARIQAVALPEHLRRMVE